MVLMIDGLLEVLMTLFVSGPWAGTQFCMKKHRVSCKQAEACDLKPLRWAGRIFILVATDLSLLAPNHGHALL